MLWQNMQGRVIYGEPGPVGTSEMEYCFFWFTYCITLHSSRLYDLPTGHLTRIDKSVEFQEIHPPSYIFAIPLRMSVSNQVIQKKIRQLPNEAKIR
jgi:hypothetical protein